MFHNLLLAYFGGFTVFWFIGVDQLFFAFICLAGFFTFLATEEVKPDRIVVIFALFVFATFFSVFQISTSARYITYIRNEAVYMAMFFVLLSSTFASAWKVHATDKLYFALLLFSVQCSIVAFMASNGINISFKSLAAYVIPDLNSKYLSAMMNKSSLQAEANWFMKGFYRPRGLMMYPNTMAGILASSMAIKAYFVYKFWRDNLKVFAIPCFLLIILDIFSIYSSLSRSTWLGFAFAIVVFPFVFKTNFVAKLLPVFLGSIILLILYLTGLTQGIASRFVDKTHSNESRGLNYTLIWQETTSSIDKFLFGHGTQIDHWMLGIPLGSHSTYLGVFFKFGVIGSIFFVLFLFLIFKYTYRLTSSLKKLNTVDDRYIRPYFLCFAIVTPVVQMTFIEVDVDFSYAMYFSALLFLLIQEGRITHNRLEAISPVA